MRNEACNSVSAKAYRGDSGERAMHKILSLITSIAIASIAMIAFHVPEAKAEEFTWSITSPPGDLYGSGMFDATSEGGSAYLVTSIPSGTVDGLTVTLIASGGFEGNDNYIYSPPTTTGSFPSTCGPSCQLDDNGLAFLLSNGGKVDIFESGDPTMVTNCDTGGSGSVNNCQDGATVFSVSPFVAATPLPAALPLFATGLGAMGLLGWRRKRKNASAIAAA